jgi:hypothetical protein
MRHQHVLFPWEAGSLCKIAQSGHAVETQLLEEKEGRELFILKNSDKNM